MSPKPGQQPGSLIETQLHAFFQKISASATHAVMLGGDVSSSALNRWVIMGLHARQQVTLVGNQLHINRQTDTLDESDGPSKSVRVLFDKLEAVRQSARTWPAQKARYGLPMAGGLVACIGYDFYRWCDSGWQFNRNKRDDFEPSPELLLFEFEDWLLIDLVSEELVVLSESSVREASYYAQWHACLTPQRSIESINISVSEAQLAVYRDSFEASLDPLAFEQSVDVLKHAIAQGELYQANLSVRLGKQVTLEPLQLLERLCRRNPSPFSAFLKWPQGVIVCNSPERLVRIDEQRRIQTRPIAGTRGRGASTKEDSRIGEGLRQNIKERAEHLMLVDLARNDLGQICEPGSVTVDTLLNLERYSHVTHLVSNVSGQLRADQTPWDSLRALFPGGTITGCPKIRCVDLLNTIEPVSRGFYTGSLGYLDAASSAMDFNILIRSVFLQKTAFPNTYQADVHVGAGIVYDAVGAYEYRECLRKATVILEELYQLENARCIESCASGAI